MQGKKSLTSIRGVTYETQSDAAKALGVTKSAINAAAKTGTLDYAGLGPRRGRGNDKATQIRGVTYETRSDAAKALGVSPAELSAYLRVSRIIARYEGRGE